MSTRIGIVGMPNAGKSSLFNALTKAGAEAANYPFTTIEPNVAVVPVRDERMEDVARTVGASSIVWDTIDFHDIAGLVAGAHEGLTLLNMSTVAPDGITALAERLAAHGVRVVDAPVSGGPVRAADGTLTIMASGADADIDGVSDVLNALGGQVFRTGPLGTGQVAKLCNNMLAATIMIANAEALTLAAKAGLDPAQVRDIVLASSGGSTVLDTWVPRNLLRDVYEPGFALRLMHKDAGLARDLARRVGVPMPLANLAHELYGFCMQGPGADRDYSFVSTLFQDAADITVATGRPRHDPTA